MHHGGGGGGHGHAGHHGGHGEHHAHHHGAPPSSSASWNMAMQAESFWSKLLKANQKPMVMTLVVSGSLVGWLYLIHAIHQKDEPDHVVSSKVWAQKLSGTDPNSNPMAPSSESAGATQSSSGAQSVPSAFGSPNSAYASDPQQAAPVNNRTYSNRMPSMAPLMFSRFMPGGYSPSPAEGQAPPLSSMMVAPNAASNPPSGFAMPQQLMPPRVRSAERYKVVVSR